MRNKIRVVRIFFSIHAATNYTTVTPIQKRGQLVQRKRPIRPTGRLMPMQRTGRADETRAHNLFVHPALMAECAETPAASPPSFQSPPFQTPREITATAPCPNYFVPFCYSFFKGCNKVNSQSETGEDGGADTALLTKRTRICL